MTINSLQVNSSTVVTGLGTQTFNVVTAGLYTCAVNFTVPYIASGGSGNSATTAGGSSCLIVINQNGSPVLTLATPTPYQPTIAGSVRISAAANDTITVVLSSSAAVDNQPNAIKGTINLYQGE